MPFPLAPFPVDAPNVSESAADKYIIGTYLNAGLVAAVNELAQRVAVLEVSAGPVAMLPITAEQEAVLQALPIGMTVELVGPTATHTLTVSN